jgi:hypothetical protein
MGTRINGYYNNPAIGQAFDNLAGMFAPPDATEILAYAQAAKARQETEGLTDLYGLARDPNADVNALDRLGAVTGQWSPTSGFGARDMASADRRYGTDVGASVTMRGQNIGSADSRYSTDVGAQTSLANNQNSTRAGLVESLFGPLNQGQVRPQVPANVMDDFGMPGLGAALGLDKPLSETEVEGDLLRAAIGQGQVTSADAANSYKSDIPIEEIIGAAGTPQIVSRADAVGQQPYNAPGSQAGFVTKTYITPDGRKGTARSDPNQAIAPVDAMTGEQLPQGTILGDITDTQSGMTASTNSDVQKTGLAINDTKATVQQLQHMIAQNPGSTGLAGTLRGTVQDVLATGDDLAHQWGGQIAELQQAVAANPELAAVVGPNGFDPSIPAIEMQSTLLAFQLAKVLAGGDRISNQQFDYARQMVGSSALLANTSASTAKLSGIVQFLDGMAQRREGIQASPIARVNEGLGAGAPPAAPAAPTRARNPQTGETVEWNGSAWVPVQP